MTITHVNDVTVTSLPFQPLTRQTSKRNTHALQDNDSQSWLDFVNDFDFHHYRAEQFSRIKSAFVTDVGESNQNFQDNPHLTANALLVNADDNPSNLTNTYWQSLVMLNVSAYEVLDIFDFDLNSVCSGQVKLDSQ